MVPRPGPSGKVQSQKKASGSLVPPRPKLPARTSSPPPPASAKPTPPCPPSRAPVPRPTPAPAVTSAPEVEEIEVEAIAEEVPEEIALDPVDVVDDTEPSVAPPVAIAPEPEPAPLPAPVALPPPPPMPRLDARPPMRSIAPSLPSQFELDSIRKSSPPVAARRRELQKLVASAVGIAWFICIAALGQTALRSLLASVAGH